MRFLSDKFLKKYVNLEVDWGPVGEVTYRRTYSNKLPGGKYEEWYQTVERVVNDTYTWQAKRFKERIGSTSFDIGKATRSAERMYDHMFNFRFLPPGRGLANMGTGLVQKTGACVNNCGFVSTGEIHDSYYADDSRFTEDEANLYTMRDIADPFRWATDMLMLGVGIGFDTKGAGAKIPSVYSIANTGKYSDRRFTIPDSREGWADAVQHAIMYRELAEFDASKIRREGSSIRGTRGKASGPEPLLEALNSIIKAWTGKEVITEELINDTYCFIGRAVVAGGQRRSALISLFNTTKKEALQLKDPTINGEQLGNYRWASNHSVVCENSDEDYLDIVEKTKNVSELGIFWINNARNYGRMKDGINRLDLKAEGCNPCAEQTLEHKELCCLVEVFPSRIDSEHEFKDVLKYAYLYAKTVTCIPVHDKDTKKVIAKNRRIGTSLTGIQQAITQLGLRKFYKLCDTGYAYLKQLDEVYSSWLSVNRSIKITSVKPSGTVSKLPGVTSGMHWAPSKAYWQTIRFSNSSPILKELKNCGYKVVNLHPQNPNTSVVYFGVIEKDFSKASSDVSMWEQMEVAAGLQYYWADNQVSCTISYKERSELSTVLEHYAPRMKSISFFKEMDHGFEHAPWQPADEKEVKAYIESCKPVNYEGKITHDQDDLFCSGETCVI